MDPITWIILEILSISFTVAVHVLTGVGWILIRLPGATWAVLKALMRWTKRRMVPHVRLGPVKLTDSDRIRHCHIVGSSGSGKTEATKLLIFEDIRQGRGCFIIDPKGDRELFEEVRGFCRAMGREADLKLLSANHLDETSVWNPCGLGNASELQSKFYNSNVYSEAYYAKACEVGLIRSFNRLMESRPKGFGLNELVATLREVAEQDRSKAMEGLFFDFESIAQSEWAKVLGCDPAFAKGREVSLLEITQKNQILFVDLPTEGKSLQSSRIGRLLTQELILISGLRKAAPKLMQGQPVFSVFIDEFDAFATDSFITFLNKARSSRFMIHIIHQTLSDLKKISPEFLGQVLGLCNIHLIGIQHDPDDAELWARFIGTQLGYKKTIQTDGIWETGRGSIREVQEFIVSPGTIKNLGVGRFVASVKTQGLTMLVRLPLAPRFSGRGGAASVSDPLAGRVRTLAPMKSAPSKWKQLSSHTITGG
jgi:hypothetical protein